MTRIRFRQADGSEREIEIEDGVSLMEGAVRGGVDGIDADCGGVLSCATCHVKLDAEDFARLSPPSEAERDMLEFANDAGPTSRLSCQLIVSSALEGLRFDVPGKGY